MTDVASMLDAHPGTMDVDRDLLARAIEATTACAQTCTACADACLAEQMVAELRTCIRLDLDCASVCRATAEVLTRRTGFTSGTTRALLDACVAACRACGDDCERHGDAHEHCRLCAETCRACEAACRALLESLS